MKRAIALVALLALVGCATTLPLTVAQTILEPYSFTVNGEASGGIWINSRFLAIDADVFAVVEYRGTDPATGRVEVLWRREFQRGKGQRAYRVVFGVGGKFLSVIPATWAEARASMPHMPPPDAPARPVSLMLVR